MLIDWFTVVAQALNFLLLVWLLKRYLYQPILRAIDERDRRIAAQLQEAEAKKAEAARERSDYQQRNAEWEQHRQDLYQQTRQEVGAERQRLTEEARAEVEALREKFYASLRNEQQDLSQELSRRTRQEVFAIARKTLADLAGADLEEQMADVFIRRLNGLEGKAKEQLTAAFHSTGAPLVVRSAFALPPERQDAIRRELERLLGKNIALQFDQRPEQLSGIELSTDGYKVAWSIADYLSELEKGIAEWLPEAPEDGTGAKTTSETP